MNTNSLHDDGGARGDAVFCLYDCRLAAGNLHSKPMCLKCLKQAVGLAIEREDDITPEPSEERLNDKIAVNALYTACELNAHLSGKVIQSVEPGNGRYAGWVVINFAPKEGEDYRTFMTLWVGGDRGWLDPEHDWDMALHYTKTGGGSALAIYRSHQPEGPEYLRQVRCEEAAEFVAKWEVKSPVARKTKEAYLAACERVRAQMTTELG